MGREQVLTETYQIERIIMAAVTAAMVKELRERTGLGMMECKKALVEVGGDIEKAIDEMRKSGQAKAAKKAGRTAAEGAAVIATNDDNTVAVMVEINSETDFVARDDNFLGFANKVAEAALAAGEAEGAIGAYVHGGKIGVLVALKGGDEALGRDVA